MKNETLPESEILRLSLDYLKMCHIYSWRNNTGSYSVGHRFIRFGKKGSSDILGICPDGRFLAVECKKSKGGILSDDQKKFLSQINTAGGVGIVVNSLESLITQLKEKKVIN